MRTDGQTDMTKIIAFRNFAKAPKNYVFGVAGLIYITLIIEMGPGSSVGIAAGYRLDGLGIESRWGRDFSHTSRPALRPTQPPVQWVPGFSRG
jgi:hypothetical protein